jgi:hypothetical protein
MRASLFNYPNVLCAVGPASRLSRCCNRRTLTDKATFQWVYTQDAGGQQCVWVALPPTFSSLSTLPLFDWDYFPQMTANYVPGRSMKQPRACTKPPSVL